MENYFRHYKSVLSGAPKGPLESTAAKEPDLSKSAIKNKVRETKAAWEKIIKKYLGDKSRQYEILAEILKKAPETLEILRDQDEKKFTKKTAGRLEAIVRIDGSRPSFMIKNGEPNLKTSPVGDWASTLTTSQDFLLNGIACVGRIDTPVVEQQFAGTGFLVGSDFILTNRHVLQLIAVKDGENWLIDDDAFIDFGHEYKNSKPSVRRKLKRVVFCGSQTIKTSSGIDHSKLDLALIELEPAQNGELPKMVLSVSDQTNWNKTDNRLFTIGYPGSPEPGVDSLTLLEQLFKNTYGYKRIAPGKIFPSPVPSATWSVCHDATTLGGNSGSPILIIGKEYAAVGLHYGGRSGLPRANWGHILSDTLDQTDGTDAKTLRDHLKENKINIS